MVSLQAARSALKARMERPHALSHALAWTGDRVGEIQARMAATEAGVRPIRAPRDALEGASPNIDRAVSPAAAVLRVFDVVHGLELPLLAGAAAKEDLLGYLALVDRLEEALRFLADNCSLAVDWLSDIVDYIGKRSLADPRFMADLVGVLSGLKGVTSAALDVLDVEFCRLLTEHSASLTNDPDMSKPRHAAFITRHGSPPPP
ncbi:exocyst complex component EXO70A1-like [Hordeum vulgare]|nr:exocyst complex component EXO70A1-like [Hordeum vulgare]